MPSFKDTNGREWLVTLNVAQVKRVRERLKINLADLQEGNLLVRLADPVTLVDVLFVLVQPQAEENSVTDEQFASALGGDTLSSASTALLAVAAKTFADAGDSLDEMSQRTGVSVESLSQLQFGLDLAGSSLEGFEKAIRKQQKTLAEAAGGSKSAQKAFADLGLDWKQLQQLSPEEQFLAVADAISRIDDPGQRAAAALEVFGKGGAELIPILAMGADGISKLKAEADGLGLTMSTKNAQAAAAFSDAMPQ